MRKPIAAVTFLLFSCSILSSQPYIISTIAGTNRLLDGNNASGVPLRSPFAIALDAGGNLYISDEYDNRIRKIGPSGIISTLAGNGLPGNTGDRGRATTASLNSPVGVAVDSSGNLYIADRGNARVRRVSADGTINTFAGNGVSGFAGDNGPAVSAEIDPIAVAVDGKGNVFIADGNNFRIRKVNSNGTITTIAGSGSEGYSGDNGPATSAFIGLVTDLKIDSGGNIYLADVFNGRVRKIDTSGQISTVAGAGNFGRIDDGSPAVQAVLLPAALAFDNSGNLYIADANRSVIRRVDPTSALIYTVAGNGTPGFSGDTGPATRAQLNGPTGLAITNDNQMFVADFVNFRVRKIASGVITTFAGTGNGDGGPAASAFLNFPEGLAVDNTGNVVIADTANFAARRVSPSGSIASFGQLFGSPFGVAADSAGNFYVTDSEPLLLKVTPSGVTSISAGNGLDGYSGDNGPATSASLSAPTGVAVDGSGNTYVTDFNHSRVRKIAPSETITTIAGNGNFRFSGDNGPALSAGLDPYDVAADGKGNLYVVDQSNNRIRKIAPDGTITTVAGTGAFGYSGDGGLATSARLAFPTGVAVDSSGNLYIADNGNSVVRRVTSNGLITTIAGTGSLSPSAGDGGPAAAAQLDPWRVAVEASGNVYVTDSFNDRVRKLTPTLARPGAISISSGNNQQGAIGGVLPAPLVVKITGSNGAALSGVIVTFAASPPSAATLDPSTAITLNDGTASATVTLGGTPGTVTIAASAGGLAATVAFTATIVSATAPTVGAGGVVSAGLSVPAISTVAPNSIVSIFGTNFAPSGTARNVGPDDLVDGKVPTNLAGVCATFGGQRAPIFAVYPGQLNVQVPRVSSGDTAVQVITQCDTPQPRTSNSVTSTVQAAAPELFYFVHNTTGHNPIAAVNAITGAYVGADGLLPGTAFVPAKPGDVLTLFGTGFGATSPDVGPGELPGTVASVTAPETMTLGGVTISPSDIFYVGLSQEAGVYQVSFRVPDTVDDGDQPFIITVGGVPSAAGGYITVRRN